MIMKIFLGVIVLSYVISSTRSGMSFRYEKMHNFGLGRRVIPSVRLFKLDNRYEHPEPLPSSKPPEISLIKEPYHHLHQGFRRRNKDRRVFRKDFDYPPSAIPQLIKCESLTNCTITYISVTAEEGIPIIFRGGAGYRHFTVLVRAKPGDAVRGNITVFCEKMSLNATK